MADHVLEIKLFLEKSRLESSNPVPIFLPRIFHFFSSEHRPFVLFNNRIVKHFFNLIDNLFELPEGKMRCRDNFKKGLNSSNKFKRMWSNVKSHEFADTVAFNDPFTIHCLNTGRIINVRYCWHR